MNSGSANSLNAHLGTVPLRGEAVELRGWVEAAGWLKILLATARPGACLARVVGPMLAR